MMQSAHFVSLMRIGFFWGTVMSLVHEADLQPKTRSATAFYHRKRHNRTDWVPATEDTVCAKTVLGAGGHRDEVATNGVVAAVLDLKGMMLSMIRHTILRSIHSHYDTSRQHCVVGILVQ